MHSVLRFLSGHVPVFIVIWLSRLAKTAFDHEFDVITLVGLSGAFLAILVLAVITIVGLRNARKYLSYNLVDVPDDVSDLSTFVGTVGMTYYVVLFLLSTIPPNGLWLMVCFMVIVYMFMRESTMLMLVPIMILFGREDWHFYVVDGHADNADEIAFPLIVNGSIKGGDLVKVFVSEEITAIAEVLS